MTLSGSVQMEVVMMEDALTWKNLNSQATWHELDVWVNRLGVDPMFAIRAATYWPAVAMKADSDVGTVVEGKYADIIAVKGDVLRFIELLARPDLVIKHGVRYRWTHNPPGGADGSWSPYNGPSLCP